MNENQQDITERKRAEQALRDSEARLRAVLDVLPLGVFIADADGRLISVNPAADVIWCGQVRWPDESQEISDAPAHNSDAPQHSTPGPCTGRRVGGGQNPAEYGGWWSDTGRRVEPHEWGMARALRSGETCGPEEIEIECFDGTHKTVINYATPIRNNEGRIAGAVAVDVDVTARKQAEKALRESEAWFRRAIENAGSAVVIAELDGAIHYANRTFLELLGYDAQEVQTGALRWNTVTPPEYASADAEAAKELLSTGIARPYEKEYVTKDGRRVPVLVSGSVIRYGAEGQPQVVIFITDLTSRKQMETEMQRWNEHLESQVAQRTDELTRTVSRLGQLTMELSQTEDRERKRLAEILHDDLQQMLAAAKFQVGLLSNRVRDNSEVQEMARQVKELLAQAIDKSRSLSHELSPPALGQSDLCETFEWLAEHIRTKHGLTVQVENCGPVEVRSEPLKAFLFKAAQEMLFNVIKHAGVKEARLRLQHRGDHISLSVTDKGRGFEPQSLGKSGFGLLTIRERVKLLGGRMKIVSAPGKGSAFLLKVPAHASGTTSQAPPTGEPSAAKMAAQKKRQERSGKPGLRILLVDDHKIVREGIEAMLIEEQDIKVVGQAGNGREAVEMACQLQPDAIVMDVSMPVMAGDEATRQIKLHLPHVRVIALSMFDDPRTADRMRRAGASAYLLKTAPSEELLAAIRGSENPSLVAARS